MQAEGVQKKPVFDARQHHGEVIVDSLVKLESHGQPQSRSQIDPSLPGRVMRDLRFILAHEVHRLLRPEAPTPRLLPSDTIQGPLRCSNIHAASDTDAKNAASLPASRRPSVRTPEQRSRPNGRTRRTASATFSGLSPPARNTGLSTASTTR